MKLFSNTLRAGIMMLAAIAPMAGAAQSLKSAYYTQDYKYRHDMNPAMGNDQSYIAIPIIGNLNAELMGNVGVGSFIYDNPRYGIDSDKKKTTFLNPYLDPKTALSGFHKGNNRVVANISMPILSIGFKGMGGYNTIELNSRTNVGVRLPYELMEFAVNTQNQTYNISGVGMHAQSFVELGLGHSHDIGDKLRIGAKMKILLGVARADMHLDNFQADMTSTDQWTVTGQGIADVYMKGFRYDTDTEEYESRPGTYEYVSGADVKGAGLGGAGFALDLGAVYKITDELSVNAAILDMGFIHWNNDMNATTSGDAFTFNGFRDIDTKNEQDNTFEKQGDKYMDQIMDFVNLQDNGDLGGRNKGIGCTLNLGAEYKLPSYDKLSFGLLSTTRFQGKYTWNEERLSVNIAPVNWLDGGISMGVGSFGVNMGYVLNLHPKGINLFVGMDRLLSKCTSQHIPLKSRASLNFGFNVAF